MPELPEVETIRRGAEPLLVGRRLDRVELRRRDLRWPIPVARIEDLVGRRCRAVDRRSKYLLLRFNGVGQPVAIVHLGMSGRLLIDITTDDPEWRRHEHWRMRLDDRLVRFVDPRRFGCLDAGVDAQLSGHRLLEGLGQEPLHPEFDGPFLHRISRKRRLSIKSLLMDGRVLAGVGNIYASEACWHAHVRPRRAAGSLRRAESAALAAAIKLVLQAAISAGGTSFRDYVGVAEDNGYFARELTVYEREGSACRRCQTSIKRTVDAGRSTYWCPGCQR